MFWGGNHLPLRGNVMPSKVLLFFGTGTTIANTTVPRNTSKAPKESKRTGDVKVFLSFFCFFSILGVRFCSFFFYETIPSLLCFLFGIAEQKTKLILVKKQRLCFS